MCYLIIIVIIKCFWEIIKVLQKVYIPCFVYIIYTKQGIWYIRYKIIILMTVHRYIVEKSKKSKYHMDLELFLIFDDKL